MIRYVIDASSLGPLLLRDEAADAIAEVARGIARGECIVPAHWRFEAANMLLVAERAGRIDRETIIATLTDLKEMPIEIDTHSLAAAFDRTIVIAREYRLTVYDAAYFELAERLNLILITLDKALASAARSAGVEVIGKPV